MKLKMSSELKINLYSFIQVLTGLTQISCRLHITSEMKNMSSNRDSIQTSNFR